MPPPRPSVVLTPSSDTEEPPTTPTAARATTSPPPPAPTLTLLGNPAPDNPRIANTLAGARRSRKFALTALGDALRQLDAAKAHLATYKRLRDGVERRLARAEREGARVATEKAALAEKVARVAADNARLAADNAQLKADNKQLAAQNADLVARLAAVQGLAAEMRAHTEKALKIGGVLPDDEERRPSSRKRGRMSE